MTHDLSLLQTGMYDIVLLGIMIIFSIVQEKLRLLYCIVKRVEAHET